MTPLLLLIANVPESLLLSMAFLVGAGGQRVLIWCMRRYWPDAAGISTSPPAGEG